jgi:hypothetical protein
LIDDHASGRRDVPVLLPVARVDDASRVRDRLPPVEPRQVIDVGRESIADVRGRERDLARASNVRAARRELRAHRSRQAGVNLRLVKREALVFVTSTGRP